MQSFKRINKSPHLFDFGCVTSSFINKNMEQFIIKKNVPVPERFNTADLKTRLPFDKMEIGDTFFVPFGKDKDKDQKVRNNVRYFTKKCKSGLGISLVTRKMYEDGKLGIGIWRTA